MKREAFLKKKKALKKVLVVLSILFAALVSSLLAQVIFTNDNANVSDLEFTQNKDSIGLPDYVEGEVLVKFKKGVDKLTVDSIVDSLFIDIERHFRAVSRIKGQEYVHLKSRFKTTQQMQEELSSLPQVADVSPNYILHADATTPNDPRFSELWGLHNTGQTGGTADVDIDAPEAWDKTTGSPGVIVAVVDTGIDYNHPDLVPNVWVNPNEIEDGIDNDGNGYIDDIHGINAITGSGDPMDDNGHGSHCSGTIGAAGNNGLGVVGVNWNIKIMATKFLNSNGSGSSANSITCIDYIIDQKTTYGQDIVAINASYGGGGYNQSVKDAIDAAGTTGIIFCAAAGNNYTNNDTSPHYPSSYTCSNIIAVTAVDHNGNQYYNYGPTSVDLGAPGRSILSTVQCDYNPTPGDVFFDDMESGASLWTHGGTLDSWDITNAASGGLENYWNDMSYGNFWSDSPGTGYVHNVDNWLATANDIDLSSYTGQVLYLGFDGGFQMDYFVSNDTAAVEISNNSGTNWTILADLKVLYYGYGYYYIKQVYLIPEAYRTANFRFRFHITSDDTDYSYYGYKNKGWIIDNIGIGTNVTCGYEYKNGTSMATPHVTGTVALVAGYYPGETVAERIARILDNTVPLPSLSGKCVTGGLLNLDSALDIVTPTITVISPNGGEFWETGSVQNITWSSTGPIENVKIEYSIDNGTSWTEIIASTPNDRNYNWTVPDNPSDNCLIRVSDTDGEAEDVSDGVFSIVVPASITITSPNGDEDWAIGSSQDITWTSSGPVDNVKIEYSINSGTSWTEIIASTPNDGNYNWTVPDNPSDNCLVRITDTDGYPADVSDAVFSIVVPSLTLTSPNGGENWGVGHSQDITWTSKGIAGNVKLEYSVNNGSRWIEIDSSTTNDGNYSWTIPDNPSEACRVRVSEIDGPLSDQSNNVFSISVLPNITVTSPNGGENLKVGSSHNITWTSTGPIGNVKIEYCTTDRPWMEIISSTPNDGTYTWTVPAFASENFLVRVSETDGQPSDVSDAVFTISFPTSITITSPNGGECWQVGSIQTITWTSHETPGWVSIQYSTDNGNSWKNITYSTNDDGQYNWTVPNEPSGNCLVRIKCSGNVSDDSDAEFSIYLDSMIKVTSPNGGENLQAGSSHQITWTSAGPVGNVKIGYSTDNGNSWTDIAPSTANDGSYNWTVPNIPSTNCLVRVSEAADGTPADISDAVFSIYSQPFITVASPNGGENWQIGSLHNITWASTQSVGNVKIDYSTDNGSVWRTLVASTANDGSYSWTIPESSSSDCLVRVSETDGSPADVSNAVFSIVYPPSITVTSPNGGENWEVGSSHYITWTSTGTVGNVKIQYSINNGSSWTDITASIANDGSYNWTIPQNPSTDCLVRVSESDGEPADVSNAVFAIVTEPQNTITITSPNGGESLYTGTSHEITWTSTGTVGNLFIQYSANNGNSWTTIVESTENDGSYNWIVPDNPSANCLVRIAEKVIDNPSDTSDAVFSIISPFIMVTSPNGGESLTLGSSHEITWTGAGPISNVSIDYSTNNGNSWTVIVGSTENDGSYHWTLPDIPSIISDNCLVRIRESDNDGNPWDTSDEKFSIIPRPAPAITVTYPNGGETLYSGSNQEITWTGSDAILNVNIAYSIDNGVTWTGIISSTPNNGSYEWTVPENPSDMCLIRVSDTDGEPADISNTVFSIELPSSITVTSPNGGETLYAGSEHEITWASTGTVGNVTIEYSINSGNSWLKIVNSTVNDGSYNWIVPGNPSDHCLVRIRESEGDTKPWDVSDAEFSIDASSYTSITVISPNGGETLYAGSTFEMTWTSTGIINDVKIEYSTGGETSWIEIAASTPNDGSYTWSIPDTPSSDCLVRISETEGGPSPVSDESDAEFEISTETEPTITVTSPNGGETLYQGSTFEVTWTSTGSIENVSIEYSMDGGLYWTYIVISTVNNGSYNWVVPDTPSQDCLVRIRGIEGDLEPLDVSDAVFFITEPISPLTIMSPNGGESLMVDSIHEITWTSTGEIETLMIEYSADNGISWIVITPSTPNEGSYEWTVPDDPSDNCWVRIRVDDDDNSPADTSDAEFSIIPWSPQINVTYPNGGEVFYGGLSQETTWTAPETITHVMIELSTDNGASWRTLIASTVNDGYHQFIVPEVPSETCLVRISDTDGPLSDVSDAVFTIEPDLYKCGFGGIAYETGTGAAIAWVVITFVSEDGSFTRSTITNGSGYYQVPLPPQRYVVTAVHPEFHPYSSSPGFFVVTGDGYQTGNFFLTKK